MREKIIFTSAKIFVVWDNGKTYGTCFSVRGENRYKTPPDGYKEHKLQQVHIILLTDIGEEIHGVVHVCCTSPFSTFESYSVINGEKHPLRLTRMLSEQMTVTYHDFCEIINIEADKSLSIDVIDKLSKVFRRGPNGLCYERGVKHCSSVSVIGTP